MTKPLPAYKQTSLAIPRLLHKAAKVQAARTGMTLAGWISAAMQAKLDLELSAQQEGR